MTKAKQILSLIRRKLAIKPNSKKGKELKIDIEYIFNQIENCTNCNSNIFEIVGGIGEVKNEVLEIRKELLEIECNDCREKMETLDFKEIKLI